MGSRPIRSELPSSSVSGALVRVFRYAITALTHLVPLVFAYALASAVVFALLMTGLLVYIVLSSPRDRSQPEDGARIQVPRWLSQLVDADLPWYRRAVGRVKGWAPEAGRVGRWGQGLGSGVAVLTLSTLAALAAPVVWGVPRYQTLEGFSGTLLGASASALGVVFVFVFVIVQAARDERGAAAGSASYAAILRETRSTTALAWSLSTLFLNGTALVVATTGVDGASAPRFPLALSAAGALSAAVAIGAVGWSVVRTLKWLSPGALDDLLDAEVSRFIESAVAAERRSEELHGALERIARHMNVDIVGLWSFPEEPEAKGPNVIYEEVREPRTVADLNLRALQRAGGHPDAMRRVRVRAPGETVSPPRGWVVDLARRPGLRDRLTTWVRLGPPPERRHLAALETAHSAAVAAVRAGDAVSLGTASSHVAKAVQSLLQERAKVGATITRGAPAFGSVADQAIDQFDLLWRMLDRESAGRELTGVVADDWMTCARDAVERRDATVLHGLMDVLVSTAYRRARTVDLGARSEISQLYVVLYDRCVQDVASSIEKATTVDELDAAWTLVYPLMSGGLGLLIAAYDGVDQVRQRALSEIIRLFTNAPGGISESVATHNCVATIRRYRSSGEPLERERAFFYWRQRQIARWCADTRGSTVAAVFAYAADSLTTAPRREIEGSVLAGPRGAEELEAFAQSLLRLVGGMPGLLRGYRVLAQSTYRPHRRLSRTLGRRWAKVEGRRLSQSLTDGVVLAGLFAGSVDPSQPAPGRLAKDPKLAAIIGGGGPASLPLRAHEISAELSPGCSSALSGWVGHVPSDASARAAELRGQLTLPPPMP